MNIYRYPFNKVKTIVEKGEIAHYLQFFLLSQYFPKCTASEASESVCKWERVNKNNINANKRNDALQQ